MYIRVCQTTKIINLSEDVNLNFLYKGISFEREHVI